MFGGGGPLGGQLGELMKAGPHDRLAILINREREGTPCNQYGIGVKRTHRAIFERNRECIYILHIILLVDIYSQLHLANLSEQLQ